MELKKFAVAVVTVSLLSNVGRGTMKQASSNRRRKMRGQIVKKWSSEVRMSGQEGHELTSIATQLLER